MSDFIIPINPKSIITDHRPKAETAAQVKNWFEIEKMELNFGDEQGRPSKDIQVRRETLDRLFADGWYVVSVKRTAESGEWERVVHTEQSSTKSQDTDTTTNGSSVSSSSSTGTTQTSSTSESQSEAENNSAATTDQNSNSFSSSGYNQWFGRASSHTNASGNSNSTTKANNSVTSNGTVTNNGSETSRGSENESYDDREKSTTSSTEQATSETTEGGAPYWSAYAVILLERKRMQADKVLQTMVSQLVESYNQGKQINLDRYDELVSLYALMLDRTEKEGNKLIEDGIDFTGLFGNLKDMILNALASVSSASAEEWKKSREDEINRKFDAIVGQVMAKLVSEGRYNTTVYTSEVAGTERERQYALNNIKEELLNVELRVAELTSNVGNNLISAQTRIFEALQKKRIEPINLRNTVFKYMLDFMERREDPYQDLAEMPTIAERLGYSGGIAFPGKEA